MLNTKKLFTKSNIHKKLNYWYIQRLLCIPIKSEGIFYYKLQSQKKNYQKIKQKGLENEFKNDIGKQQTEWEGWPKTEHPTVCYKLSFIQTFNSCNRESGAKPYGYLPQ